MQLTILSIVNYAWNSSYLENIWILINNKITQQWEHVNLNIQREIVNQINQTKFIQQLMIKDKTLIINQIKEGKPDREAPLQIKLYPQKALMN